jgi:uncharacterized protein with HEPN domain
MFDKELVLDSLSNILSVLNKIEERSEGITCGDDFASSPGGMLRLDAVCMNLIAIGEAVKGIDKLTHGELLPKYPEVYWSGVMRMRDKIAHHYFEVDADVVYNTIKEDVPPLKGTIRKMIKDLSENKDM